jgi:hypothetical protein
MTNNITIGLMLLAAATASRFAEANRFAEEEGEIDFGPVVASIQECNSDKNGDRFVVFEVDSKNYEEVANPDSGAVSLEAFKDVLRQCGPHGKVCVGFYSFQYPLSEGSATMAQKTMLVKSVDEVAIKAKIGSMIKAKRAVMGALNNFWIPLEKKLHASRVQANFKKELSDADEIDEMNSESLVEAIRRVTTRWSDESAASFASHIEAANSGAEAGETDTVEEYPLQGTEPAGPSAPAVGRPAPAAAAVDEAMIAAMVEKMVEERMAGMVKQVESRVEKIAKKAAQEQVGNALKRMSSQTQELASEYQQKASFASYSS